MIEISMITKRTDRRRERIGTSMMTLITEGTMRIVISMMTKRTDRKRERIGTSMMT